MPVRYRLPPQFKIISGGQSGADQAALDWAIAHGVAHGGWCPKGRRSEDGPIDPRYQLTEATKPGYLQRTEWNVRDSDATLIVIQTDRLEGGSMNTAEFAEQHRKPCLVMRPNGNPDAVARWLERNRVTTLNVAGSRESKAPGIAAYVTAVLDQVLELPLPPA